MPRSTRAVWPASTRCWQCSCWRPASASRSAPTPAVSGCASWWCIWRPSTSSASRARWTVVWWNGSTISMSISWSRPGCRGRDMSCLGSRDTPSCCPARWTGSGTPMDRSGSRTRPYARPSRRRGALTMVSGSWSPGRWAASGRGRSTSWFVRASRSWPSTVPASQHRLRMLLSDEELARVTISTGDITDGDALGAILDAHGITNVIHLAALQVPFCRADPVRGAQVNVVGTVVVFEQVRQRPRPHGAGGLCQLDRHVRCRGCGPLERSAAGRRHGPPGHPVRGVQAGQRGHRAGVLGGARRGQLRAAAH